MTQSIATLGIAVTTKGVTEASRQLGTLEKQSAQTEKRVHAMGKAMGVAIAAGAGIATAAFGKYIANTIEAEKVQAQLAARIKSTGSAAGLAVGDLNKMAAALQKATTFDDESIGRAQATLLTFTRVGKENFQRATEAVLDLSTALGTDLNGAALQVGKALNDPVQGLTALSRAGVQFSDSQKTLIKELVETNRTAEAQRVILGELETQMGGSARAARDTLGGALQALRNSFDNLLEGDAGNGGIRGTRQAIEDLNTTLNNPGVKSGVDTLAAALFRLIEVAAQVPRAFALMGTFIGATLGEMRNQAAQTATIMRNLSTFGMADGTIKDAMAQSAAGRAQWKRAMDDLALGNGGMTRDQYNQKFGAQFDLGLPGTKRPSTFGGGGGFNFAADMAARAPARNGGGGASPSGGGMRIPTSAEAKGVREVTEALRDFAAEESTIAGILARADDDRFQAIESWARLSAELGGPLKQAEFEHIQRMTEIQRLGRMAGATADEITAAKAQEAAAYRDATEAILEQQRVQSNPEAMRLMDDFRMGAVDAFTDIVTGARSAKDAFRSFMDDLAAQITRAIANKWMESLFGSMGSSGEGSSMGGGLFSFFSSLFGSAPGRAIGGPVRAGGLYEVGERGPEMLSAGGRNYMIPNRAGMVAPMQAGGSGAGGRGDVVVNQVIRVEGRMDRRTPEQIARESAKGGMRAMSRTGR